MQGTKKRFVFRLILCVTGMFICALGTVLMLRADLGMNPWGILHQGMSLKLGISFGRASQYLGLAIVVFCALFRCYPGIATVLYIFFFGYFTDLLQSAVTMSRAHSVAVSWLLLFVGNTLLAAGSCLYLCQKLGAGPKDELMLLITQKIRVDVAKVRIGMELTAVLLGYLMGGPFGMGTLFCALSFGPTLRRFLQLCGYDAKSVHQENILDTMKEICSNSSNKK